MTLTEYREGPMRSLLETAEAGSDLAFAAVFSRKEDRYAGSYSQGMDALDALILVKEMAAAFSLGPIALASVAPANPSLP